ncbi:MAG: imidazolonepropionase [Cytophagales bacterium]|nr:imidazolonepropionase [Cytophagales bacterium]
MSTLYTHAKLATLAPTSDWGLLDNAALLVQNSRIAWLGAMADWPASRIALGLQADAVLEVDMQGRLITPALIDCHTHLVYVGNRANEFEMRLQGATYEEIARAGGGIKSTVAATRAANDEQLLQSALIRAKSLMAEGVATIEIKSGYGLSELDEARSLRIARKVGQALGITVKTTYLAAHALPPEFADRPDDYISAVCEWLPRLHSEGLVDAVDAFCEGIGFSTAQTRRVFEAAKALGLPVKLHAEQLSDLGGSALAASFGAMSCDHLEHLSASGIAAMKSAGTVAVLLPGAYYFLRETKLPPIQALRDAGVPIAIATDHNPGSSPTLSPLLMLSMACTFFKLTPLEAFAGMTLQASRALGLQDRGTLAVGQRADLAVWNVDHPNQLCYPFGGSHPLYQLIAS